jgi:hypothetical protein
MAASGVATSSRLEARPPSELGISKMRPSFLSFMERSRALRVSTSLAAIWMSSWATALSMRSFSVSSRVSL